MHDFYVLDMVIVLWSKTHLIDYLGGVMAISLCPLSHLILATHELEFSITTISKTRKLLLRVTAAKLHT